jgi:hypothetical protein
MNSGEQSVASAASRHDDRYERVTSRAKTEAVLRLLKGESVDTLSQELGVNIRRIERWKDRFLEAGSAELARRQDESSKGWLGKKGWFATHASSIWQWTWVLVALVAVISFLAVFMQRGSPD